MAVSKSLFPGVCFVVEPPTWGHISQPDKELPASGIRSMEASSKWPENDQEVPKSAGCLGAAVYRACGCKLQHPGPSFAKLTGRWAGPISAPHACPRACPRLPAASPPPASRTFSSCPPTTPPPLKPTRGNCVANSIWSSIDKSDNCFWTALSDFSDQMTSKPAVIRIPIQAGIPLCSADSIIYPVRPLAQGPAYPFPITQYALLSRTEHRSGCHSLMPSHASQMIVGKCKLGTATGVPKQETRSTRPKAAGARNLGQRFHGIPEILE